MTPRKPTLLQLFSFPLPAHAQTRLAQNFTLFKHDSHQDLQSVIKKHGHEVTVLLSSAFTPTGAELIDQLPNLHAICSVGVGYDSIDVRHAQRKGILVSNTPDVLNDCVADMAWALILGTARQVGRGDRYVRAGQWSFDAPLPLGTRVTGKKLGIVGLGRVGLAVAERAAGFKMQVRYHNRKARADSPWMYAPSLLELAAWADFLVVATVGGASTRHLIDAAVLKALGPQGILVNIARGSVVDEAVLLRVLQEGGLAGAGLDVFENEPQVPEEFKSMDNVLLQPHVASATNETRQDMFDLLVDNAQSYALKGKLLTPVPPLND